MKAKLNDNHRRRLVSSFQHIDHMLGEVETIIASGGSASPFRKHVPDMSPVQRRVTTDYIARIRETMQRCLGELGIVLPEPDCGTLWAARATLAMMANVAMEELGARYLKGYGALPDDAAVLVDRVRSELQAQAARLNDYLRQAGRPDLRARLKELGKTPEEAGLLHELDRIISARGMVELRGTLDLLLERLEDDSFHIGVFGRVSSGKSSLLNYLLGDPILAVGVTPVTALPVRVSAGDRPGAVVEFAEAKAQPIGLERLGEYCSEQGNPANVKHVTRITVRAPVPLLRDGVTFVDTPGLGSLALAGAAETVAYVPRCDLGIVLVDAGSTVTHEDLVLVEALYRAGATAMVLVSKADVLSAADRTRAVEYTRRQLQDQVRVDAPVYAVSVRGPDAALCDTWLKENLQPVLARHQTEAALALKRKVGALREAVAEALRCRTCEADGAAGRDRRRERESVVRILSEGEAALDTMQRGLPTVGEWAATAAAAIIDDAALESVTDWANGSEPPGPDPVSRLVAVAVERVHEATTPLREGLLQLHARLRECLRAAESALGHAAEALDELPAPSGLPVPDFGAIPRDNILPDPPLLVRWHGQSRERWVRRQYHDRLEPVLRAALVQYGKQADAWGRQCMEDLRVAFRRRSDYCRALLGTSPEAGPKTDTRIEEDLRILDNWGAEP